MRVRILDEEALGSADPRNIRVYLRTHGWTPSRRGRHDVWELALDGEEYEVLAPSSEFADFRQQVSTLLYTLSAVEDRSELDVLRDLSSSSFDIQHFRKSQTGPPGTVSLAEAAKTFQAARDLVSAAATSIEIQRPVLPAKSERPTEVKSLLNRVLTGPPEAGSFVASIWVPVPPRLNPDDDQVLVDDPHEPFERRVTRRLNEALVTTRLAVQRALGDDGGLDAFLGKASTGLTADLCDALVSLAGGRSRTLEVRFAWALDRPTRGLSPVERFDAAAIDVLKSAADTLRKSQRRERAVIRGRVQRLNRHEGGGGDVVIKGSIQGEEIEGLRVAVSLAPVNYELAVEAHRQQADVEITGTLQERGLMFTLTRHGDLSIAGR